MRNSNSNKSKRVSTGGKRIGKSLEKKNPRFSKKQETTKTNSDNTSKYSKPGDKKPYSKYKPKKSEPKAPSTGDMRLNRFIANAGVCSRREADKYIESGIVTVNGKVVTELGVRVKSNDDVRFDGRKLNAEKKIYLLLNKPKNFVTTTDDPHADKTVMDLIKNACEERIYPVGRLDRNTTGLLLFTNDGDMSKKLTHPSHNKRKIYQVSLDKIVTLEHLQQIADGIQLEDGPIAADAISYISTEEKSEVGIEIHSGKNRIVRRIFEHFGYKVKKLDRVIFAGLTKKNLPRGKWRFLTEKEVQFLKIN